MVNFWPGFLSEILADRQGVNFMLRCSRAKYIKMLAYHPQCNGPVERFNAALSGTVKIYMDNHSTSGNDKL